MVERVDSHKKLKGISAVFTSAFLAASCSGSSLQPTPANETPTPTIRILPTETPIFTATPEITSIPTPELTPIVEKTLAEQAREAMFKSWLNTLNSGLRKDPTMTPGESAFNVKAVNINEWQTQKDLLLNGGQSSKTLNVSWAGGHYREYQNPNDWIANKYAGQIEINNAEMLNQGTIALSDADIANGITWHEDIKITYIERHRSGYYSLGQGPRNKIKAWVISPENISLDFTPWHETFYEADLILVNGKWQIKPSQLSLRHSSRINLSNFVLPYEGNEEIDYMELDCGTPQLPSCEKVNEPIILK